MQNKLNTTTDPQVGYRPSGTLEFATALAPYTGRFGPRQAAHLLRRAGFGGSATDVADLTARGMSGAVDSLLHPTGDDFSFPDYPDAAILTGTNFGQSKAAAQMW